MIHTLLLITITGTVVLVISHCAWIHTIYRAYVGLFGDQVGEHLRTRLADENGRLQCKIFMNPDGCRVESERIQSRTQQAHLDREITEIYRSEFDKLDIGAISKINFRYAKGSFVIDHQFDHGHVQQSS